MRNDAWMLWLCDRAEITDAVLRFALAFDLHDWGMLRGTLADEVSVDYSAFRGDPPATMGAGEYVRSREAALGHLRMQHVSTNHLVEIGGDQAVCRSCYLVHRLDPARPEGENTLDSAGHYVHRLIRTEDGWKIRAITQTLLWSRGNPEVHGALPPPPPEEP